jgi:Domain of unknown function (DUF4365)
MPTVTDNLLQGNYAEHLAAQVLSRSCLVRPVIGQTDVGVDLYCESVIDGQPFMHFWGQVKSSKAFTNEKQEVSCSYKTDSLRYWQRQPVPVLGFLVPLTWPPDAIHYIHIVDISFDILEHGIRENQDEQTLHSKPDLILPLLDLKELDTRLRSLLYDHLPMAVSALYAAKGLVYHAPKPTEEDVLYYSHHFLHKHIFQIDANIRNAVVFGIRQYLWAKYHFSMIPKAMMAVLEKMKDEPNWDAQECFALLAKDHYEYSAARVHYERAIEYLRKRFGDEVNRPPWSETLARLTQALSEVDRLKALQNERALLDDR